MVSLPHIEPFKAELPPYNRWTQLRILFTTMESVLVDPFHIHRNHQQAGIASNVSLAKAIVELNGIVVRGTFYETGPIVDIRPIEAQLKAPYIDFKRPQEKTIRGPLPQGCAVFHVTNKGLYLVNPAHMRDGGFGSRIGMTSYEALHNCLDRGLMEAGNLRLTKNEIERWYVEPNVRIQEAYLDVRNPKFNPKQ